MLLEEVGGVTNDKSVMAALDRPWVEKSLSLVCLSLLVISDEQDGTLKERW
jgi:hypothetical protein